ncbi:cytochrome P450 CYP82D47-like protein [Tanacetum coccineum]
MLEVFSQQKVDMLGQIRVLELRASMKYIYETWLKNQKNGNTSDMVKVEMSSWFANLVFNIMVRILSGKRYSPDDEEGVRFQKVAKEYFKLLGVLAVSDFIPYFKFFDVGGYSKSMKKTGTDLDIIFEKWLKERKIEKMCAQQHEGSQVFIDALIDILQCTSEDAFTGFDHDTIIKSTCQQLLTASLDSTSGTLTWALSLLLNNLKALEIAQNELDEHVGRDRLVEESDMKKLVYIEAILKETLRLYPPAPRSS